MMPYLRKNRIYLPKKTIVKTDKLAGNLRALGGGSPMSPCRMGQEHQSRARVILTISSYRGTNESKIVLQLKKECKIYNN